MHGGHCGDDYLAVVKLYTYDVLDPQREQPLIFQNVGNVLFFMLLKQPAHRAQKNL